MSGIKPILNSTSGFWIDTENNKLMIRENGVDRDVINSDSSSVIDILQYENVVLSPETLDEWIRLYGYGSVLNEYILNDQKLLTIGTDGSVYGIALSGESGIREIRCIVNDSNWSNLQTMLTQSLQVLNTCSIEMRRILEDRINSGKIIELIPDPENPEINIEVDKGINSCIQLVKDTSLTDYVSFKNLVRDTGEVEYSYVASHEMYYDEQPIYRDYSNHPYSRIGNKDLKNSIKNDGVLQRLQYDLYEKRKIYERIVGEGDILDITISYYNPKLDIDGQLQIDGSVVLYDGIHTLIGSGVSQINPNSIRTISALIQVANTNTSIPNEIEATRIMIGKDILAEVSTEGLVVYSLNPDITEYFIRSCRLLYDKSEQEPPTNSPADDSDDSSDDSYDEPTEEPTQITPIDDSDDSSNDSSDDSYDEPTEEPTPDAFEFRDGPVTIDAVGTQQGYYIRSFDGGAPQIFTSEIEYIDQEEFDWLLCQCLSDSIVISAQTNMTIRNRSAIIRLTQFESGKEIEIYVTQKYSVITNDSNGE